MKWLIPLAVLLPIFAADPQGVMVLKSSDLKSFDKTLAAKLDDHKASVEEFSKSGNYRTSIVHREGDGDVELENDAVLFIIESGQATLVSGKTAPGEAGNSSVNFIKGGGQTAVAEGDVVVIPANVAHQVLVAHGKRVSYLVIRQLPQESPPGDTTSAAPPSGAASVTKPVLGVDLGSGFRACVAGDNSPEGTIVDGYRKMLSHSFLGANCIWKPEVPPETVTKHSTSQEKTARPGADVGEGYRSCLPNDNSPNGTLADGYRKVVTTSPFGVSCGWEKTQ
jgi:mannose-6-phosphate isomerase-like protein (cupin superfamily)